MENTAALGRLSKEGMKESNYLDAIMRAKYARNPDKLRAWESASRLERPGAHEENAGSLTAAAEIAKPGCSCFLGGRRLAPHGTDCSEHCRCITTYTYE